MAALAPTSAHRCVGAHHHTHAPAQAAAAPAADMDLASFFKPKSKVEKVAAPLKPAAKPAVDMSNELLSPASSPASEPAGVGKQTAVAPKSQQKAPEATPKAAVASANTIKTKKAPSDFFKPRAKKKASPQPSPAKACAKQSADTEAQEKLDEDPSIQSQGEKLTTGDIVWAKYDDYPWWPCYLSADPDSGEWIDGGKVRVIFFGDDTEAWLAQRKVQPFLKNLTRHRKDPQIQQALSEALNKLGRADLIEGAAQEEGEDAGDDKGRRTLRPRRATSQEKQRAAAEKILASNRPKRLKKSRLSEDEEADLDLGLSDDEEEDEGESDDESGSEYGGSDGEEDDEDEDVSEGEPEDEDLPPPSEDSDESEEEEAPKPQRKRKRVSFGAGTKGEMDDEAQNIPAVGRASIDSLNAFACDTASEEAAAAKVRQGRRAKSSQTKANLQKSPADAAPAAAAPVRRVGIDEEMDPSKWKSLAEQGDYKRARQVRFQQWINTG